MRIAIPLPWKRHRQIQFDGDGVQPLIVCPQLRPRCQPNRGEEMDIVISDATPEQGVANDEMQNFRVGCDDGMGQVRQGAQHHLSLTQIAQGEFADDKRMAQNHSGIEQPDENLVAGAQMINPDGRIDQDHVARSLVGAVAP